MIDIWVVNVSIGSCGIGHAGDADRRDVYVAHLAGSVGDAAGLSCRLRQDRHAIGLLVDDGSTEDEGRRIHTGVVLGHGQGHTAVVQDQAIGYQAGAKNA